MSINLSKGRLRCRKAGFGEKVAFKVGASNL